MEIIHRRAYKGSNSTIGFRKTEENLENLSTEVNVNFRSPLQMINQNLKIFPDIFISYDGPNNMGQQQYLERAIKVRASEV